MVAWSMDPAHGLRPRAWITRGRAPPPAPFRPQIFVPAGRLSCVRGSRPTKPIGLTQPTLSLSLSHHHPGERSSQGVNGRGTSPPIGGGGVGEERRPRRWSAWSAAAPRRGGPGGWGWERATRPRWPAPEGRPTTSGACTATRPPTTSAAPPSSSTSRRPSTSCGNWCGASTSRRGTSRSSAAASCAGTSSRSAASARSTSRPASRRPPAPRGSSSSTTTSTYSASSSSAAITGSRTTHPS